MSKKRSFTCAFNKNNIYCNDIPSKKYKQTIFDTPNSVFTKRHTIISILSDSKLWKQNYISKNIIGIHI